MSGKEKNLEDLIKSRIVEDCKRVTFNDSREDVHVLSSDIVTPKEYEMDDLKRKLINIIDTAEERSLLNGIDVEEIQMIMEEFGDVLAHDNTGIDKKTAIRVLASLINTARRRSSFPEMSIGLEEIQKLRQNIPRAIDVLKRYKICKPILKHPEETGCRVLRKESPEKIMHITSKRNKETGRVYARVNLDFTKLVENLTKQIQGFDQVLERLSRGLATAKDVEKVKGVEGELKTGLNIIHNLI